MRSRKWRARERRRIRVVLLDWSDGKPFHLMHYLSNQNTAENLVAAHCMRNHVIVN